MALAFETAYGTPLEGGFARMPFARTSHGLEKLPFDIVWQCLCLEVTSLTNKDAI